VGDEEQNTQGVIRVQNVVLHGPADSRTMAAALRPAIERSRDVKGNAAPACLVITPTVEQALAVADLARTLFDDDTNRVVPVTAVVRARRVLQAGSVAVVSGAPHDLLALRADSALNLEALRAVVLIGLDELLADGAQVTLESILADAPVDAMRIATLDSDSAATEAFFEAHLRRARHVNSMAATDGQFAVVPRYAVSTPAARAELLRAVLDEIDPPTLAIVTVSEAGETDARRALARLGLSINGDAVSVARHAPKAPASLVVLWEAPAGVEALTEAVAGRPLAAIAFLLPDEVPSFHRLTGGAAEPWIPTVRKDSIESRTRTLRTALRSTLANGGASASELALLAPLLDSHDAIEIAAAALRLYEGARREAVTLKTARPASAPIVTFRGTPTAATSAPPALVGATGARQRVFLAVGKRDGVAVRDIVGAVANEANIEGSRIGSVDVYESHTTVELNAEDAARVVELMGNTELRGRRLGARIDEREASNGAYGAARGRTTGGSDRPARGGFGRDRGEGRGSERGDRSGARPARSFGPPRDRGERSDRPDRGEHSDRGERPDRVERSDRGERPARPSFGGDRSERPSRPSSGSDRGERSERPSRPSFGSDRGDRASRGPSRSSPPRSSNADRPRSSFGASRGEPRASEERRSFGDRPIRERTEARQEWSSRGDSMKNAKRTPRKTPGTFDEV
jgi:ATP-dependent RNA helicase DeaD